MKPDEMDNIVEEWQRIFPRLRALPCTADISCLRSYTGGDDMTEGLAGNMTEDLDEDMTEDSDDDMTEYSDDDMTEDSDDDEIASSQFNFRIKLWRTLGYGEGHLIHEVFEHMWQTNVETEIIGWPVVPISVFHDPGPYSTTAN
jgi:hypothetical protein